MTSVLVIAGAVLGLPHAFLERFVICKALLVRDIIVDLRVAVYDKMPPELSLLRSQRIRLDYQSRHRDVQRTSIHRRRHD